MAEPALRRLAAAAGLAAEWRDFRDVPRTVPDDTLRAVLTAMRLDCDTEARAAETLKRLEAGSNASAVPAGGPARAFGIDDLAPGARPWGIAAQVYALRRAKAGPGAEAGAGAGDYTALAELATRAAREGADALGISPVHALFNADPNHFSPYAPSSRLFLNAWHVDPCARIGATACADVVRALGLGEELRRLEAMPLVDWPGVVRARMAILRELFARFRRGRIDGLGGLDGELRDFRARGGDALEGHARFEALHAHFLANGGHWHWREWPAPLRDARNPAVRQFANEHAEEVDFHVFLQWLADHGLAGAQAAARRAGMKIGLVADLAVGTHDGGSHAWSHRDDLLVGVSVGAPPDELNGAGQNWGLTTFSPTALRAHRYQPFIDMLRAAMRHAGGVRIDHVLGLNRLWLIPDGAGPQEGVYLRYPLDEMLQVVAQESHRQRAVVIGEDLGTVPPGFRDRMEAAGLLGLRVLWFERDHGYFTDPSRWTRHAVATTSTHDVATVAGWWGERDLDWREKLGAPPEQAARDRIERGNERRALWAAFRHAGTAEGDVPHSAAAVVDAAVRHVARAPSQLAMIPLEDVCGEPEQPNLPGTIDEHPNWRRRWPAAVDALLDEPRAQARLASLRRERGP